MAQGTFPGRRRLISSSLTCTLIAFSALSCSVKETRESCPCRVGLDYSSILEKAAPGGVIRTFVSDAEGNIACFREDGTDTCLNRYEILLRKGVYTCTSLLCEGGECWEYDGSLMQLREGRQADSLYGEALPLEARGEEAEARPEPLKQFATLHIRFAAAVEKLGIAVSLPSSLIDGRTLSPSERTFPSPSKSRTASSSISIR